MNVGDLVQYQNMRRQVSKCVGIITEIKQREDWYEPVYMVDWAAWPGEPWWYHMHNLKLISEMENGDEKTTLV